MVSLSLWEDGRGIAESNGICNFRVLRTLHNDFCTGCTGVQSYQQCRGASFSPQPQAFIIELSGDDHTFWDKVLF